MKDGVRRNSIGRYANGLHIWLWSRVKVSIDLCILWPHSVWIHGGSEWRGKISGNASRQDVGGRHQISSLRSNLALQLTIIRSIRAGIH